MLILSIRTDKPDAEIGLYANREQIAHHVWQAHRQLAETLHTQIRELLARKNKSLEDLSGIICFQGPGSFTGLRIGLSVANALSYSLGIPIVATQNDDWEKQGVEHLLAGDNDTQAQPFYGADAHITLPKK